MLLQSLDWPNGSLNPIAATVRTNPGKLFCYTGNAATHKKARLWTSLALQA